MATKLTVKRLDLIKAIEDKAKANKDAFEKAQAELVAPDFVKQFNELLARAFPPKATDSTYATNNTGYTKGNIKQYFGYVLTALGVPQAVEPAQPKLFEKELAVLNMAQDEQLSIDDSSDYFSFLKP